MKQATTNNRVRVLKHAKELPEKAMPELTGHEKAGEKR